MIRFSLESTPYFLASKLDAVIEKAFSSDDFDAHGVKLIMRKRGDSFVNIDGQIVFVNCLVDIELQKGMGLFTTEASGVIDVSLALQYDITKDFKLTVKSQILNHKWVEKPRLEIGSLSMSVESLVEFGIKHYESIITAKIDQSIKESVDLTSLVKSGLSTLQQKLSQHTQYGMGIDLLINQIYLERPQYKEGTLSLNGGLVVEVNILESTKIKHQSSLLPSLEWKEKLANDGIVIGQFEVPNKLIETIMTEKIKGQSIGGKPLTIKATNLNLTNNVVKLVMKVESPIDAVVTLDAIMKYEEENQKIHLNGVNVDIEASSFIYKLSAPIVSNFIEGKISEIFPIELGELIMAQVKANVNSEISLDKANITPSIYKVWITKLQLEQNILFGKFKLDKPHVHIHLV